MKLTTKGQYAIVAMNHMKEKLNNGDVSPTRLADIAEKENISLNYLEQIFRMLRIANLVYSVRGPGGGYQIAVEETTAGAKTTFKPAIISYKEILEAVDEKVSFHENLEGNAGTSNAGIVVSNLLIAKNNLMKTFNATTI